MTLIFDKYVSYGYVIHFITQQTLSHDQSNIYFLFFICFI
jgi:hypothetical protein